jgi:hypothetical protein
MLKTRHCPRCNCDTRQEISCQVNANHAEYYGWWCLVCKGWTPSRSGGIWIKKELLEDTGVDLSTVRVVENKSAPRCAKCGTRGAELHHWAPQAMFGKAEADQWPKDYLCKACHDQWHRMVTPKLVGKKF